MNEDLEKQIQRIDDLEKRYTELCCDRSPYDNYVINAFHEWIRAAIVLLSRFYPDDDADFIWITQQDYSVDGVELLKLQHKVSLKYHLMLERKRNKSEGNDGSKKPLVFISHKSSQTPFVTALVNLLVKCGFTKDNLFCSSVPGYNIGLDQDIVETLRKKFVDYDLYVIFVLSTDFFQSPYCLNEMGAAWVLQKKNSIIITLDTDESQIGGVVNKNQARVSIKDAPQLFSARMKELRNNLLEFAKLPDVTEDDWNKIYGEFIEKINLDRHASNIVTNQKSQLVVEDLDDIVMKAINILGEFTIKELQTKTGIQNYSYIVQKINTLVQAGVLIPEGLKKNRKYKLKA